MSHKTIEAVARVTDLEHGEQAFPEKGVTYSLRQVSTADRIPQTVAGPVKYIQRRGDTLYAHGDFAECYPVNGDDAWVLVPKVRR